MRKYSLMCLVWLYCFELILELTFRISFSPGGLGVMLHDAETENWCYILALLGSDIWEEKTKTKKQNTKPYNNKGWAVTMLQNPVCLDSW
jgi:hypothetical protein